MKYWNEEECGGVEVGVERGRSEREGGAGDLGGSASRHVPL